MDAERSRRWMVVGGAGLVGSHLRDALGRDRDVVVTAFRRDIPGALALDVTDAAAVARVTRDVRPDVIVAAAAQAYVERCEREPAATRRVNVDAVRALSAAAPDALLVVFSSEYVFDGTRGPYVEGDPVSPINEYGRQKVDLEAVALGHRGHLVCRTSSVYGWSAARTSFVARLVDTLRAGERSPVASDQLMVPTPAPDLARAVVELVERGARGVVHVAGPEVLERLEFARRAAGTFGLDRALLEAVPTERMGLVARRPLRAVLRTDLLKDLIGHGLSPSAVGLAAMRDAEPQRGDQRDRAARPRS